MKIGIFGGTFNPVHNGHLTMLEHFVNQIPLDKCYIVPTSISPFKQNFSMFQANDYDRIFMLKLALENYKNVEVLDYEILKGGISYTIDTLRLLKGVHPDDELYLLIGADQAIAFDKWKSWEEIVQNTFICVVQRPDLDNSYVKTNIESIFRKYLYKIIFIEAPIINITATQVREKIKNKENIDGLVPEKVAKYIKEKRLYIN